MHRKFYRHVKLLIRSDGLDVTFDALHSGRKNPELYARLFDLVESFQVGGFRKPLRSQLPRFRSASRQF